jgi:hypothetical protein
MREKGGESMLRVTMTVVMVSMMTFPVYGELVTFDFDSGTPALGLYKPTPFDVLAGSVVAQFSSPGQGGASSPAFSIQHQNTTFYSLSTFQGKYLCDSRPNRDTLQVAFSSPIDSVSVDFATMDLQDNRERPSDIVLEAYWNTTDNLVGTATSAGRYTTDTFPQGTLQFESLNSPFNLIRIHVPWQQVVTTPDFMVDNIRVNVSSVPEPTGVLLLGAGLLGGLPWLLLRRGRR